MPRVRRLAPGLPALLLACSSPPATQLRPENALDRVLAPLFEREGITPRLAEPRELCRRMIVDLLGILPSQAELAARCPAGASAEELALALQADERYLRVSERHWHDRLSNGDLFIDWRYLKDLYARIDELHRGRLHYAAFAEELSIHPGFVMPAEPPERVALLFRAFAGRPPSTGEVAELTPLYTPFYVDERPDPDFNYLSAARVFFDPAACLAGACTTQLFGGATILGREGDPIPWERLDRATRANARAIGRLLVAQPFFHEAAADEILDRLLGWSDGGRFPRRPGVLLPEVRQRLAELLAETGDYPAAERLVLGSWLYGMSSERAGDEPVYAVGPLKPASAEVWLDSLLRFLDLDQGGQATCDVRYLGSGAVDLFYEALEAGRIDQGKLQADLRRLHGLMEDRRPLGEEGADDNYEYWATMIGGCPPTGSARVAPYGLAFAHRQEALANLLCSEGTVPGPAEPAGALAAQMQGLLGRDPTGEELQDLAELAGADLKPALCVALAGSAEHLFY